MILVKTVLCALIYLVSLKYVYNTGKNFYKNKEDQRIYDVSHKHLPNYFHYKFLKDLWILLLLFPIFLSDHPKLILREIFGFAVVLVVLRSVTTAVTILPKTDSRCDSENRINWMGSCYDCIFSNHTAIGFVVTLILLHNDVLTLPALFFYNFINILLILSTRSHYTVDVIFALIITLFVYQNDLKV